jgi:cytochrome b subunit of formate dehydrogenase
MAPRVKDVYEFIDNMLYHVGKRAHPPAFSRFRYIEKAEYWALVWGTVVMVVTGFILWFPAKLHGPTWMVRVAEAVHLYEAWLAFLAIVVWHLFFVLFRPGIPGTFTAFTGRMDPEELAHEHPGEFEQVYGAKPAGHQTPAARGQATHR